MGKKKKSSGSARKQKKQDKSRSDSVKKKHEEDVKTEAAEEESEKTPDSQKTSDSQEAADSQETSDFQEAANSLKGEDSSLSNKIKRHLLKGEGYALWLPLACGLLLLIVTFLPWATHGGKSLSLFDMANNPGAFPVTLTSPEVAKFFLYSIPLLGLCFIATILAPAPLHPWMPWLLGGLGTLFLLILNWYNPELTRSSFHPHHTIFLGLPLGLVGAVAGGAFWALYRSSDTESAKQPKHRDERIGTGIRTGIGAGVRAGIGKGIRTEWAVPTAMAGIMIFILSAVVPEYILGQRSIPIFGQLEKLGEGGVKSLSGLLSLLSWACAVFLAWELWRGFKRGFNKIRGENRDGNEAIYWSLSWISVAILALHQPIYFLAKGLSADKGGQTYSLLALSAGVCCLVVGWSVASVFTCSAEYEAKWKRRFFSETSFWAVAGLLILAFFLMQTQGVGYTVTDENIYYYKANLVAQGEIPYRDFFFAHPPVHILIPAFFFSLFGFSLTLAKMISISAAMLTGVFVLLTAKRTLGRPAALIALCLYLFSFAVLNAGVNLTGINLTVMFLMAGVYTVLCSRPILGGVLTGLALTTGFYSAAGAAALLLVAILLSPQFGLRFGGGLLAVFGGINIIFYILGGSVFLEGVYFYHGRKPPGDPRHMEYGAGPIKALFYNLYVMLTSKELKKTILYHSHLIWGFFLALAAWLSVKFGWLTEGHVEPWSPQKTDSSTESPEGEAQGSSSSNRAKNRAGKTKEKRKKSFLLSAAHSLQQYFSRLLESPDGGTAVVLLIGAALFVQFSMFKKLHSFYFVLWYPFMAISTAFLLDRIFRTLIKVSDEESKRGQKDKQAEKRKEKKTKKQKQITAGRTETERASLRKVSHALFACVAFAFLFGCYKSCENWGHHVHESEFQKGGERLNYPWRKPKFLKKAGSLVKSLFWIDHRIRGEVVPSFRQFLWNKKRHFDTAPEIAEYIKKTTAPEETIAGASAVAPLLAILSNRRIADNFVDTNSLRFRAGLSTTEEFYERVCSTPIAYIVSAPRSFFSWNKMRNYNRFLRGFSLDRTFVDRDLRYGGTFTVRLLRRTNKKKNPPYCRYIDYRKKKTPGFNPRYGGSPPSGRKR